MTADDRPRQDEIEQNMRNWTGGKLALPPFPPAAGLVERLRIEAGIYRSAEAEDAQLFEEAANALEAKDKALSELQSQLDLARRDLEWWKTERDACQREREADIRAAFEAGHWTWPSPDAPNRQAMCDAYVRKVLADVHGRETT